LGLLLQRWHPLAQLGERHQPFLIGGDQTLAVLLNPHLLPTQLLLSLAKRVGVPSNGATAIDLALHPSRIFQ
jgi:hypothetical protein